MKALPYGFSTVSLRISPHDELFNLARPVQNGEYPNFQTSNLTLQRCEGTFHFIQKVAAQARCLRLIPESGLRCIFLSEAALSDDEIHSGAVGRVPKFLPTARAIQDARRPLPTGEEPPL